MELYAAAVERVGGAESLRGQHVHGETEEEDEEVAVVSPPNAVVHPSWKRRLSSFQILLCEKESVRQWWSKVSMQRLQELQWVHRGGLKTTYLSQQPPE